VIRGLVRGGTSVLLTTQYIEEADRLADMATIINHGRIITSETPAKLKAEIGGERLEIRLADANALATVPQIKRGPFRPRLRTGPSASRSRRVTAG
jgi:ABC-2 type transport system ATP-binding protein